MKTYNITFEGYFISKEDLPKYGGIYAVFVGKYNRLTDRVSIRELIYIGEAGNINDRHQNHEKQSDFDSELQKDEILIYAICNHAEDRVRIQDAIIYKIQPKLNTAATVSFNHPQTILNITGTIYIPSKIVCP